MLNTAKKFDYHEKVNCEFSEAVFQQMASERYGIDFCCEKDLTKWYIKKELLDFNGIDLNICPDPDNPAQPGDDNFVPGPCGRLDVTHFESGGTITYVPCGAYRFVTAEYVGSGTDEICYDTNIGYTTTGSGLTIVESEEDCTDPETITGRCFTYRFRIPTGVAGEITYTDCNEEEQRVSIVSQRVPREFLFCVRDGLYTASEGILVTPTIDACE